MVRGVWFGTYNDGNFRKVYRTRKMPLSRKVALAQHQLVATERGHYWRCANATFRRDYRTQLRGGLAGRGCGRFPFHFVGLVDTLTSSRVCTVFESSLKTFSGEFTWQHLWQELWCYVIEGKYVTFKACYFSFSSKVNGFPFWGGYLFSFRVKVNVFYYCKSRKICYF